MCGTGMEEEEKEEKGDSRPWGKLGHFLEPNNEPASSCFCPSASLRFRFVILQQRRCHNNLGLPNAISTNKFSTWWKARVRHADVASAHLPTCKRDANDNSRNLRFVMNIASNPCAGNDSSRWAAEAHPALHTSNDPTEDQPPSRYVPLHDGSRLCLVMSKMTTRLMGRRNRGGSSQSSRCSYCSVAFGESQEHGLGELQVPLH
ncbi:hypothetical protein V8C26DRAFT_408232 [Trichoderma gracile]